MTVAKIRQLSILDQQSSEICFPPPLISKSQILPTALHLNHFRFLWWIHKFLFWRDEKLRVKKLLSWINLNQNIVSTQQKPVSQSVTHTHTHTHTHYLIWFKNYLNLIIYILNVATTYVFFYALQCKTKVHCPMAMQAVELVFLEFWVTCYYRLLQVTIFTLVTIVAIVTANVWHGPKEIPYTIKPFCQVHRFFKF